MKNLYERILERSPKVKMIGAVAVQRKLLTSRRFFLPPNMCARQGGQSPPDTASESEDSEDL